MSRYKTKKKQGTQIDLKAKKKKKDGGGMLGQLIGNSKFGKVIIAMVIWFFAAGIYQTGRIFYNIILQLWRYYT